MRQIQLKISKEKEKPGNFHNKKNHNKKNNNNKNSYPNGETYDGQYVGGVKFE